MAFDCISALHFLNPALVQSAQDTQSDKGIDKVEYFCPGHAQYVQVNGIS